MGYKIEAAENKASHTMCEYLFSAALFYFIGYAFYYGSTFLK